jgi:hypothetical protein
LSFLASAAAMGILAWEYRRRRPDGDLARAGSSEGPATAALLDNTVFGAVPPAALLVAGIPLTVMALLIIETFAFGHSRRWLFPTYVGLFEIWTSMAALALVAVGAVWGPRSIQKVGIGVFGLLAILLSVSLLGTLVGWSGEWNQLRNHGADSIWTWALFNPRGIGFLAAIAAAVAAAMLYRVDEEADSGGRAGGTQRPVSKLGMGAMLGVFAHLTGLGLLTSEVYAQGIVREWHTGTSLGVTLAWTLYAIGTLVAGIYWRSATVRILGLALFALTTAKVLAKAIERLDAPELVIAATESTDGYTGTVPEQIAELLGRPSVTFAKHIEAQDGVLKVQRQTEEGYDEITCPLPAVVSVTAGVVEPRYPSFKGIMAAKSKPVDQVTAADLGVTPAGWAGAGQKIVNVAAAEARQAGEIVEDDGEGYAKIVTFLENLKVI